MKGSRIKKKLDIKLTRNNWINKHTITRKSLINLWAYYHRSKVVYDMSCFLDMKNTFESVERRNLKYTPSTLGLRDQVNSNRVSIILNRPLDRHIMWVLMRKNMVKYKKHLVKSPGYVIRLTMSMKSG